MIGGRGGLKAALERPVSLCVDRTVQYPVCKTEPRRSCPTDDGRGCIQQHERMQLNGRARRVASRAYIE